MGWLSALNPFRGSALSPAAYERQRQVTILQFFWWWPQIHGLARLVVISWLEIWGMRGYFCAGCLKCFEFADHTCDRMTCSPLLWNRQMIQLVGETEAMGDMLMRMNRREYFFPINFQSFLALTTKAMPVKDSAQLCMLFSRVAQSSDRHISWNFRTFQMYTSLRFFHWNTPFFPQCKLEAYDEIFFGRMLQQVCWCRCSGGTR